MPQLAILAAFILIFAAASPATANDELTNYNYKSAPKGQTAEASEEEKSEAAEEAKKEEEELTPQQQADRERRKITGESSDVARGDEHKWPHIGRKR
jgi:uncharacterized protein YgiB involved in biofilm formation